MMSLTNYVLHVKIHSCRVQINGMTYNSLDKKESFSFLIQLPILHEITGYCHSHALHDFLNDCSSNSMAYITHLSGLFMNNRETSNTLPKLNVMKSATSPLLPQ